MLLRALLASVLLALSSLAPAAPVVVPEPVKDWQAWVLHGEEFRQCPFFALGNPQDRGQYGCALPGAASIRIADGRAEISVGYRVYAPGYVELVHAEDAAPEALLVDGQPAIIGGSASAPRTWLEPGERQLRYSLDLAAQPESLMVPQALRLIELSVDGRPIFPLNRAGGELWLQRAETATESDALEVVVHRLWRDGIPQQLETRIEFHVAGKAREIRLGPAWPEGYELTTVDGDLRAVIEPGRMLRMQSTAGSFQLTVSARALERADRLGFEFPASDWPQQEIWSFAANHQLRIVDVSGAAPIDPAQADVPGEWMAYPAFAMASGDALTLAERSRGLGDDANRLSLQRELWLDFDGDGYTIQDRIHGRMRQGFRMDLAEPYTLLSASERGEPLLVTDGGAGVRGIELRYPALNVEATARLPWTASMPAHGWSERLDGLATTLHLPPGYRLLHAGGADRAPQAWIERWDIYAVFIAAFAVVLAWRLGGLPLAAAVAVLVLLGVHENDVPRYSLIALLLLLLGWQTLGAGRLRRALAVMSVFAALAFAWVALPFALAQARYALHPQLAEGALSSNWGDLSDLDDGFAAGNMAQQDVHIQENVPMAPPSPMAPPPPPPPASKADANRMQAQSMEMVEVTGSRIKRVDMLERYAKDAVVQAGVGRPNWRWMRIDLGYDGPIDREQNLDLWLSPPWLTALWRLLLVAALAAIPLLLARRLHGIRLRAPTLGAALLVLSSIGSAAAADMPTPELLAELKARLTQAPECAPQCATLSTAQLEIDGDRLQLRVDAHASARVLLPLPLDDSALSEVRLTVDGESVGVLRSGGDSSGWVVVERGVHRVTLEARVRGDRLTLDFSMAPARIDVSAPNWTAAGLRDGRLLAERLELVREAASSDAQDSAIARVPVKPFVRVVRQISLDLDWTVYTTVHRVAPTDGGFSVRVPLLAGEQPRDPALRVDDGQAEVTLQPGSAAAGFDSRLSRSEALTLTAPTLIDRAELWRVVVGPSLSLKTAGVPVSEPEGGIDEDDAWVHEFHPLPGETLTLTITRPAAVPGATLVADSVDLSSAIGARSRTHTLNLSLRATQGGSHALTLPADGELLNLAIDGRALNLKPEAGVLTLPIKPGTQQLNLSWREDIEVGVLTRTPSLDLGLDAANVTLRLALPADRWILRLGGPAVGPAVLYWSGLIVLLLIGYGLGRSGRALLPFWSWMLLVLGFSTLSYVPLLIVALAFIALDARRRYLPGTLGKWRFDFIQLLLVGLTLAAFAALVVAIPVGLLGSPDMHIAGSAGSYGELAWLADRSSGALPTASAITLPLWAYKALMLAFALWLASAVIGWIKLAWSALTAGTGWMRLRRVAAATPAREPRV
jgi:hypothetical protein